MTYFTFVPCLFYLRISKKYEGTGYNGKQQYVNRANLMAVSERERRMAQKESMRQRFLISRERVVNGLATESAPGRHASSSAGSYSATMIGQGHAGDPFLSSNSSSLRNPSMSEAQQSLLDSRSLALGYGLGLDGQTAGLGLPRVDARRSIAEEYAIQQLEQGWARAHFAGLARGQQNLPNPVGQNFFPAALLAGSAQSPSLYASAMSLGGAGAMSSLGAAASSGLLGMGSGGLSYGAGAGASGNDNLQAQVLQAMIMRNRAAEGAASLPSETGSSLSPSLRGMSSAAARLDPALFGGSAAAAAAQPAGQQGSGLLDQQALSAALYRQHLENSLLAPRFSNEQEGQRWRLESDAIANLLHSQSRFQAAAASLTRDEEGKRPSFSSDQGHDSAVAAEAAANAGAAASEGTSSRVRGLQQEESGSPQSKRRRL